MIAKKTFWVAIIMIVVVMGLLSESFRYQLKQSDEEVIRLQNDYEALHDDYLSDVTRYTFTMPETINAKDEEGKAIDIKEFSKKIYFIIRIQETNCEDCIIKQYKLIKNLTSKIGFSNILIFGQYSSLKSLQIAKNRIGMPYRALNIDTLAFTNNSNIDKENVPYFFVLYHGKIKYLYFPDKNLPEKYLNMYYDKVAEMILTDKKKEME